MAIRNMHTTLHNLRIISDGEPFLGHRWQHQVWVEIDEKVYQNYLVEFAMYYNAFLPQIDFQKDYQGGLFDKNLDVVPHAFDMASIEFQMSQNANNSEHLGSSDRSMDA